MSKFDSKKITPRYSFIAIVLMFVAVSVVARAMYIMTARRDFWLDVADRVKADSVPVNPVRGNILSSDGLLMVSSLPEYKLLVDFETMHNSGTDSLWQAKIDSITEGLSAIFPQKSAAYFKEYLEKGRELKSRCWPVWPDRVSYNTYMEVKSLPVFNIKSKYVSGFYANEFNARNHVYGSLASRTLGELYGAKDSARYGLELAYDSVLRGETGLVHKRKVLNRFLPIPDTQPVDGADIVTTIDVTMQDLAERSVIDELKKINGNVGVAIVMEVATGDVKAIVNMEKCGDGEYRERKNHAVSDLLEPGSVFKTASIMVALDDGVVDTTERVETGGGVWPMYGREMRDHNWRRGGYGMLTLPQTLMVSSNVGVSRIIDDHYKNHPEKFVEGIYRLGLADDLRLPFAGSSSARIRMPKKEGRQYVNWSKTSLPWMSIGYETQVAPINTVAFYNAIANDGKMMRPRFVKKVVKNGETIMEFPPVVQKERICKPQTVRTLQTVLEHVVSQGLGKKAGSRLFRVAGKTGTAQVSKGAAGYHSGTVDYWLSFAGYFPADEPRYSCIVCIRKSGLPASGGGMSGLVFHHIAEGVMARHIKLSIDDARDPSAAMVPEVKSGNVVAADYVLRDLGVASNRDWGGTGSAGTPVWGRATTGSKAVDLARVNTPKGTVPDVRGMGASDAVYLLESQGLRVRLHGRGRVKRQSCEPGTTLRRGRECVLYLE